MRDRTLVLRFVVYAIPGLIASATSSPFEGLGAAVVMGAAGLVLDRQLRGPFNAVVSFFATIAVIASARFIDATGHVSLKATITFALAGIVFAALGRARVPEALRLGLAAVLSLSPIAYELARSSWWTIGRWNILTGLLGADGLLYGAPLLWAGILGLVELRPEARGLVRIALAGLVPLGLGFMVATDTTEPNLRAMTALPFFLPGIAACFEKACERAARYPERVLAGVATLMVLWNALFMEQYRLRLLPSDDTVSFASVTSNSAALFSRFAGTPSAWPANWIFARRFKTTPDRWDAVSGRSLLQGSAAPSAIIDVGDDPSALALDRMLIADGFGDRRTCERGWCRDVDSIGRVLLPVRMGPDHDLIVRLRVRGQGRLTLSLNGSSAVVVEMNDALNDVILRAPGPSLKRGIHILSLAVEPGQRATVDRLTLSRGP